LPCTEVLLSGKGGWVTDTLYQFENYVLDVEKRRLFRDGKALSVDLRAIDLLVILIQAAPNWVDKNELLDRLWPDQEITDWALSRLVSYTRKLLGDDGENQRLIKTVRGRGFQFFEGLEKLPAAETGLPIETVDDSPALINRYGMLKYLLPGILLLLALFFGANYFLNRPAGMRDVTAVINLSPSETPRISGILEDWAMSQDDMILIKNPDHDRNVGNINLFKHYCIDGKYGGECTQLIVIRVQKNGKALSLHYQVMSDGIREEDRELISPSRDFLISALRDAVANSMNRSSDYFLLPATIFLQNPDQIYQDMYQVHINLENSYVTFMAQQRRRDELVRSITKRLKIKRTQQYEKFFMTYFDQMNKEERFIFDQIRAMTSGTLYQCNRNMLTLLESDPVLIHEVPKLEDVRKHLAFWVNKYHNIFMGRDDMSLLYVGVEDGVPFPSGIDQQVSNWLKSHQKNKIASAP